MVDEVWDHVVSVYTLRPRLREVCLRLQDEHGVDVILLLFLTFLDASELKVSSELLKNLLEISDSWQGQAVAPIRRIRRVKAVHGRVQDGWARFRADVKALELKAERLEIELLHAACDGQTPEGGGGAAQRYLIRAGIPADVVAAFLEQLPDGIS